MFPKLPDARQGLMENGLRSEERAGAPGQSGLIGLPILSDRMVININIMLNILIPPCSTMKYGFTMY